MPRRPKPSFSGPVLTLFLTHAGEAVTFSIALLTALGLGIANFAYQWLTGPDWALAMDRTWFQTTACLAVAVADHFVSRSVGAL